MFKVQGKDFQIVSVGTANDLKGAPLSFEHFVLVFEH